MEAVGSLEGRPCGEVREEGLKKSDPTTWPFPFSLSICFLTCSVSGLEPPKL
jgi:hypothetical protein